MTLEQLAKKLVAEIKAGQIGEALDTASDILKSSAGFYKLVFGGASVEVAATDEDLAEVKKELTLLAFSYTPPVSGEIRAASAPAGVDPSTILALVQIVLQIIAERQKRKK